MTLDELKVYTVRVKDGSGCLFQPIQNENNYTYILTSKHLFEGISRDENGKDIPYETQNGTGVLIVRQINVDNQWQEQIIPFVLIRDQTYFPHKEADAAILKIDHIAGFDKIISIDIPTNIDGYSLYGFPSQYRNNQIGSRDTSYSIRELELPSQNLQNAQLKNDVLAHAQIEGMSGGGILLPQNENAYIIGIQSEMKHAAWANGKICFVPMKYFSEIVNYDEYATLLTKLHPPYVGKFDFLADSAFTLKVDFINENKIQDTRTYLRNKTVEVINSGITPISIKELFKNKLLIDETELNSLETKNIWIGWLEFLTIFNIVKDENIDENQLFEIFDSVRLKYTHAEDCTTLFQDYLSKSDYTGMIQGGTILINSKKAPQKPFKFSKGTMKNITKVQDVRGFRTDLGIDPFQSFSFIHLDYYKTGCIINKLEEYENLSEPQLLAKLKEEYHELFN